MTFHLPDPDPEIVLRTILLSGDDLGKPAIRRRWARACVRLVLWNVNDTRLRRLAWTYVAAPMRLRAQDQVVAHHLLAPTSDRRLPFLIQLAIALIRPGTASWLAVRRACESKLVHVLADVVEARNRLDGDCSSSGRWTAAVRALDERKPEIVRGCLWVDILATRSNDDVAMGIVDRLSSATGRRAELALRNLLSRDSGFLAACVVVAVSPGAFEASTYEGWTSLLRRQMRKRLRAEDTPAADLETAEGAVRDWLSVAKARWREAGSEGGLTEAHLAATERPDYGSLGPRRVPSLAEVRRAAETEAAIDREAARIERDEPARICVPRPDTRRASAAGIKTGGDALPIVRSSMSAIRTAWSTLLSEFPWQKFVVDKLMGQLFASAGGEVHLRPTILVGPPGSGKSALIRRLAELLGVPRVLVDGTADDGGADLGGSSARWSSPHPLAVTRAFERYRSATVLVLIDEVDKAPVRADGHIVSLYDALLGVLEPSTAGAVPDPALGVEVDASGVSWLATANTLMGIPDPVMDRLQVLRCESPGREHVGPLSAAIARRICADRGLPLEAIEPFDDLEASLIARTWKGGSIRQLARIVEAMIDARASYGAPSIH